MLVVNLLSAAVLLVLGAAGGEVFGAIGLAAAAAGSIAMQNCLLWAIARRELGIWTHVGHLSLGNSVPTAVEFPAKASKRGIIASEFRPVAEPVPSSSV